MLQPIASVSRPATENLRIFPPHRPPDVPIASVSGKPLKCTDPVSLQGKVAVGLRDAVKARCRIGPDMQDFIAAASYAALKRPESHDRGMVKEYLAWVEGGCQPIPVPEEVQSHGVPDIPDSKPMKPPAKTDHSHGGGRSRTAPNRRTG